MRGVQRMVDEEAYCVDVLTQIASVVAALEKVGTILLKDHVEHCVRRVHGAGRGGRREDRRAHRRRRAVPEGLASVIQKKGEMMTEKTLRVPDMSCGHCKAAVEGELSKLSGVKRAERRCRERHRRGLLRRGYGEHRGSQGCHRGSRLHRSGVGSQHHATRMFNIGQVRQQYSS